MGNGQKEEWYGSSEKRAGGTDRCHLIKAINQPFSLLRLDLPFVTSRWHWLIS
jgi:hypothetical protein